MDKAAVTFTTNSSTGFEVYGITTQCYKCNFLYLGSVLGHTNLSQQINTKWPYKLKFIDTQTLNSSSFTEHFQEYGDYVFTIEDSNSFTQYMRNNPARSFLPLVCMLAVLMGMAILWPLSRYIYRKVKHGNNVTDSSYFLEMEEWESKIETVSRQSTTSVAMATNSTGKRPRIRSLDTFRGIAILSMVFVNYGGGGYHFISHAVWNGLTFSDLVFPWFIFIMGMSINLSYKSFLKNGGKKRSAFLQICWRSVKLFVVGLVLNFGQNLPTWRIPGVLQRFGVCYFFIASLNLFLTPSEGYLKRFAANQTLSSFRDILPFIPQWIVIVFVLAAHTAITLYLPIPGCPTGYLGPGGLAGGGKHPNCTGGAAGYIDRLILGPNHIYGHPSCEEIYHTTQPYDPEGLLGFLTSIFLTFLGLHAGRILFTYKSHTSHIVRWLIWAVITGVIAGGLTMCTQNDGVIPINKNMWSLSFVLATAATSYLLFLACYVMCDVIKVWNGSPFSFSGMNAIFIYVGHMLLTFRVFWNQDPVTHTSSLVVSSFGTMIWVIWAFVLYRKRVFYTI